VGRRGSIPTQRFCEALLPSQGGDRSEESHPLRIEVVQRISNFQSNRPSRPDITPTKTMLFGS
jgi:hypothetical protein